MRVATGTVVGGKVVVEGLALDEGSVVTVIVRDAGEAVELSAEDEAELLEGIAAIEAGAGLPVAQVMAELRKFG